MSLFLMHERKRFWLTLPLILLVSLHFFTAKASDWGSSLDRARVSDRSLMSEYWFTRAECEKNEFRSRTDLLVNSSIAKRIGNGTDWANTSGNKSTGSFGTLERFFAQSSSSSSSSSNDSNDPTSSYSVEESWWCAKGIVGARFSSTEADDFISTANEDFDVEEQYISRVLESEETTMEFWITPSHTTTKSNVGSTNFNYARYFPIFTIATSVNDTYNVYTVNASSWDCDYEYDYAIYLGTDFSIQIRARIPLQIDSSLVAQTCSFPSSEKNAFINGSLNHFVFIATYSSVSFENKLTIFVNGTKIIDEVLFVQDLSRKKYSFAEAWRKTSRPYFGNGINNNIDTNPFNDDFSDIWMNTIHAFAMYDRKLGDLEVRQNFYSGLPNAKPLAVDKNITVLEDAVETRIALEYTDDDYFNDTSSSSSLSVEYTFKIVSLPENGVLKATNTQKTLVTVDAVPFECFGNGVFFTPEPNKHSNNTTIDNDDDNKLAIYASFEFIVREKSTLEEFETVESLNKGVISIFVEPVNDAPFGIEHVVDYYGREIKTFQLLFRDDLDEESDYYGHEISKIEVTKLPSNGAIVSYYSAGDENEPRAISLGDIINVTSAMSFSYRLQKKEERGDATNIDQFVPIVDDGKDYLADYFSYFAYDKYDAKSVNETLVEFRIQSPIQWMMSSSTAAANRRVVETKENAQIQFKLEVLRLDCQENVTEIIVKSVPLNGTVSLVLSSASSESTSPPRDEGIEDTLKVNDVIHLEQVHRVKNDSAEDEEQCVAFVNAIFVPNEYFFDSPSVDIFGDKVTSKTTTIFPLNNKSSLLFSSRDTVDGWSTLDDYEISFTVIADVPHAPAKFHNVSFALSGTALSSSSSPFLISVDSNETTTNNDDFVVVPNGGYLKLCNALEYDISPDFDVTFGVVASVSSIRQAANVSVLLPLDSSYAIAENNNNNKNNNDTSLLSSSVVITKWLKTMVKIAGPPSQVRDILFNHVLYNLKTNGNTKQTMRDTIKIKLEYGYVKILNEKRPDSENAKYDWKSDSCKEQTTSTSTASTTPCAVIAYVDIEAVAYPSSISLLAQNNDFDQKNVSNNSWFIAGIIQGAIAGVVLLCARRLAMKLFVSCRRSRNPDQVRPNAAVTIIEKRNIRTIAMKDDAKSPFEKYIEALKDGQSVKRAVLSI